MRITAINNNADSVRVIHHGRTYSKSELLAYASNVNEAKFADVSRLLGKSTLTHEINGGSMGISHKAPTRKNRKCIIERGYDECGMGWDWFADDEYYKNIIAYGNRDFCGAYTKSDFADIFDKIVNDVMVYDYFDYAMHDIERGYANRDYKNGKELIRDYFGIDVTSHQVAMVRKVIKAGMNDRDTICGLLTALTPHTWVCETIRGYCQSEWQEIYYPTDVYDNKAIELYEAFYMGKYMDYAITYRDETYSDFIPDFIAWDEDKLIDYVLSGIGYDISKDDVILRGFN